MCNKPKLITEDWLFNKNGMKYRHLIIALFISILASFLSCKHSPTDDTNYVVLSGKIQHAHNDSLVLRKIGFSQHKQPYIIHLNNDSTFQDTLRDITEGLYYFENHYSMQLFIKAGYNIKMDINFDNKHRIFKGKGAPENNFLNKYAAIEERSLSKKKRIVHLCNLTENNFLKLNDSIYQTSIDIIQPFKDSLDKDFYFLMTQTWKYEKLDRIMDYKLFNKYYFKKKDFKLSTNYPDPYDSIDTENQKLINIDTYMEVLNKYMGSFYSKRKTSGDYAIRQLACLDTLFPKPYIKEAFAIQFAEDLLGNTKYLDSTYQMMQNTVTDSTGRHQITDVYNAFKKIEPEQISPDFLLKDIDGKEVSLKGLRGNIVYIDIWATWCGPCRAELPHLKALEKNMHHYKDIQFVSICIWDEETEWKQTMKAEKMNGIQLFMNPEQEKFLQAYHIKGVPHFIIIDKHGKIVDNNALRPSHPDLEQQLKKLL